MLHIPNKNQFLKAKKCRCCIEGDVPCHFGAGTLKSYIYIQASVFLIVFSRQTSRCCVAVLMGRGGGERPRFQGRHPHFERDSMPSLHHNNLSPTQGKKTWKNRQEMFRIRFGCPNVGEHNHSLFESPSDEI